MDKTVDVCYAILELDDTLNISATRLRGYLGYIFADQPEFHHHMENSYHYPLVQYKKIIPGRYLVMGFDKYARVLSEKIKNVEKIVTQNHQADVRTIEISTKKFTPKNTRAIFYKFHSPWIALNQKNYTKYKTLRHKKSFLQDILIGNILSAYKGLDIRVDFPIIVDIIKYTQTNTIAHENNFIGFWCNFRTNISLIPFMGIGKSVSKGFGIISKTDKK